MVPLSRLQELLAYYAGAGLLVWRVKRGPHHPGSRAGSLHRNSGYVLIQIDGRTMRAHRIAWALTHGLELGAFGEIDHRNTDTADNRINNLRLATRAQNCANVGCYRNNAAGIKGVRQMGTRWQARLKRKSLGMFDTAEAAHAAYAAAAQAAFGDFARRE